jgi:hypothetical protein
VESLLSMCSIYDRHVMSILSFASSFCSQLVLCKAILQCQKPCGNVFIKLGCLLGFKCTAENLAVYLESTF